jgi:hypothetical protein
VPKRRLPLGAVDGGHPTLWGQIEIKPESELLLHRDAKVLTAYRTGKGDGWWERRKQGALTKDGELIEELTDWRGSRPIYAWPSQESVRVRSGIRERTVLYGGTLYEHFGHLLLDLTRLYQLLPLFRESDLPFWLHYHGGVANGEITNHVVLEWLDCLGVRDRIKLVDDNIRCELLVSSPVLYRDRCFVRRDMPRATTRSLRPALRAKLAKIKRRKNRVAYLTRTQLSGGTSRFIGEVNVVDHISRLPFVDIYTPEDLSIPRKLRLFMQYDYVVGFIQASMLLKYFLPVACAENVAQVIALTSGHQSLNSNWVNLTRAYGFLDYTVDCSVYNSSPTEFATDVAGCPLDAGMGDFQRSTLIDHQIAIQIIEQLGGA